MIYQKSFTINFYSDDDKHKLYNYLKTIKGVAHIVVNPATVYEYKTRYKYFFGHVVAVIEEACIFVNENAEPLPSDLIFDQLKRMYAPQMVRNSITGALTISPRSTKTMPDGEFIGEFEERIIADFGQHPFNLDFMDRNEWIKLRKDYHKQLQYMNEDKKPYLD